MPIKIKIKLTRGAALPLRATGGSAGYDLAYMGEEPVTLAPGDIHAFETGVAVEPEEDGIVGLVFGRSGLGRRYGIAPVNAVGVIDSDYRGEIMVTLTNHGREPYVITPGERIAQLIFQRVPETAFERVDELDDTARGKKGFGSTGRV